MGATVTRGLGSGARPDIGRMAAEEAVREVAEHIAGSNMVFITAGMGGGTGTGAAPVVAQIARDQNILTVGVVTKPFHFEGTHRMKMAESGIQELQQYVDTLIIIPNQNLFRVANEKTTFADAFKMADEVLHSGVRGVTDLMVMPGLINLDFADIRSVMSEMGKAMMGTGEATGEHRAVAAAESAISNPLLDEVSMKGAKGVLINITGGMDMTLFEVDEAANRIREEVDPEANIIFGSTFDEALEGKMRISVVATGIEQLAAAQPRSGFGLSIVARGQQSGVGERGARAEINPMGGNGGAMPFTAIGAAGNNLRGVSGAAGIHAGLSQASAPMASAQGTPGMILPTMGATALQARPMPDLAEPSLENRSFVIQEALEPTFTSSPMIAEPIVPTAPSYGLAPQAAAPHAAPQTHAPGVSAGVSGMGAPEINTGERIERRRTQSLFEKVTQRFAPKQQVAASQPTAAAAPAPTSPAPTIQQRVEEKEPAAKQTQLQLDPADRLAVSRSMEDMLDIPAFLRRQAN